MADGGIFPVIGDGDGKTGVQESLLPHPLMEDLIVIFQSIEHFRVRLEGDFRTGFLRGAHNGHFLGNISPGEFHLVNLTVLMHPHPEPLAQGVYHRGAYAVKAAGHLVAAAAELSAGMEHGVNHFQGRPSGLGLNIHGDTTAVIGDGDGVTRVDGDGDMLTVPCQGLVDGVVHDFVHQVVQARRGGGADIHTGALPNSFQSFQNLNLLCPIFLTYFGFLRHCCPPCGVPPLSFSHDGFLLLVTSLTRPVSLLRW